MFVLTHVHCDIPHIQRSQALPGYSQLNTDKTVTLILVLLQYMYIQYMRQFLIKFSVVAVNDVNRAR